MCVKVRVRDSHILHSKGVPSALQNKPVNVIWQDGENDKIIQLCDHVSGIQLHPVLFVKLCQCLQRSHFFFHRVV